MSFTHRQLVSWWRNWGARDEEVAIRLPGDEIIPRPQHVTTRAITISSGPELVWPWLVQMGYRRGGLYSYDWLDRLLGFLDRPSADEILPAFQHLRVGDAIPLGTGPRWPVAMLEPNRTLLLDIHQDDVHVTWVFHLVAQPQGTRLLTRVRATLAPSMWRKLQLAALDPIEFLMVRRMLIGIQVRAERLAARRRGQSPVSPVLQPGRST